MGKKSREKDEKKRQAESEKSSKSKKYIALTVIAGIAATISVIAYTLDVTPPTSAQAIDGINCNTQEYLNFHIHAHLDVFVGSQPFTVPALIGIIDNTCLYWLHTHSQDGIIHMEAPQTRNFTLGQFFDIWKATGQYYVPPQYNSPTVYVNGQEAGTDLNAIQLNAHDEIVVVYGTKPSTIQSFYQFPPGL